MDNLLIILLTAAVVAVALITCDMAREMDKINDETWEEFVRMREKKEEDEL